ncbi:hypothetical protein N7530_010810 [Penicillium desertorum]|uniref:Uncharacterized protein n=1 Tax=Penicillium desertorum TaxID=1303715 RepID=A0A9W9WGH8_9EURO|nr:hypothetical protein N7530_010810 [Penicillium desertorum]
MAGTRLVGIRIAVRILTISTSLAGSSSAARLQLRPDRGGEVVVIATDNAILVKQLCSGRHRVADSIAKVAPPDIAEAPKSSAVKLETGNKQPLAAISLIGMRTIL